VPAACPCCARAVLWRLRTASPLTFGPRAHSDDNRATVMAVEVQMRRSAKLTTARSSQRKKHKSGGP